MGTAIVVVRDLVIIVVGLIWIVAGVGLLVVLWMSWKLVRSVPGRVEVVTTPAREIVGQAREAVGTANEGARTAREAITFVSQKAVLPTIGVVSAVVALRRFFEVLLGGANGPGRDGPA